MKRIGQWPSRRGISCKSIRTFNTLVSLKACRQNSAQYHAVDRTFRMTRQPTNVSWTGSSTDKLFIKSVKKKRTVNIRKALPLFSFITTVNIFVSGTLSTYNVSNCLASRRNYYWRLRGSTFSWHSQVSLRTAWDLRMAWESPNASSPIIVITESKVIKTITSVANIFKKLPTIASFVHVFIGSTFLCYCVM